MERERREDLEERDAFAQRVIKRDKEKQRNAAEKVKKNYIEGNFWLFEKKNEKKTLSFDENFLFLCPDNAVLVNFGTKTYKKWPLKTTTKNQWKI